MGHLKQCACREINPFSDGNNKIFKIEAQKSLIWQNNFLFLRLIAIESGC
jgi:hypothetical protein